MEAFSLSQKRTEKKNVIEKKVIYSSLKFMQNVKLLIMGPRDQFNTSDLICLVKVAFKAFSNG